MFGDTWRPDRECWTLRRDDMRGKVHVAYVPWLGRIRCFHNFIAEPNRLIAEWMEFPTWGQMVGNFCATCYRERSRPWELLLPDGFSPPMEPDEALIIADFWEERDELAKAECIRSWCP